MSTALEGFYLTLSVTCRKCRTSVPINGLTEALPCPHCAADVEVSVDNWMSLFDADTVTEVRGMEPGMGQEMNLLGSISASGAIARRLPRCEACKEDTSVERLPELARAGGYACSCGRHVSVRDAPPFARVFLPGARWVVHEHLAGGDTTGGATTPILFGCMGCGGSLTVDGSDRAVTCTFCGASNFLPDALWHRLHPVPTVEPFFVVVDPDARSRGEDLGPALFERMAASDDCDVRAAVARNPKVPARLLTSLAKDDDWEVRAAVAANPSARGGVLSKLLDDDDDDVREAVAARSGLAREILDRLLADDDWEVRRAAVRNPEVTPEQLLTLAAKESDNDVLQALGELDDLAPAVIEALANNSDWEARRAAARHPATPDAALEKLSKDDDRDVREAVARRSGLPLAVLLRLGRDDNHEVSSAAQAHPEYARAAQEQAQRRLAIGLPLVAVLSALAGLGLLVAWKMGWLGL